MNRELIHSAPFTPKCISEEDQEREPKNSADNDEEPERGSPAKCMRQNSAKEWADRGTQQRHGVVQSNFGASFVWFVDVLSNIEVGKAIVAGNVLRVLRPQQSKRHFRPVPE